MTSEHIVKSVHDYQGESNIGDLYQYMCESGGQAQDETITLNEVFSNKSLTLKKAIEDINTIAQNLYQHYEFRPGDCFAFYSLNSIDYVLVTLAVWKLRGIHVGLNPFIKPGAVINEVQRQLNVVDCKFILTHPFTEAAAKQSVAGTKVTKIFVKGESSEKDCVSISTLLQKPTRTVPLPSTPVNSTDMCAVLFSSGTSGLPKACEISVRAMLVCLYNCGPKFHAYDRLTKFLIYQPMSASYGLGQVLAGFLYKITLHLMDRFDFMTYLKCVAKHKIPVLALVPPIAVQLVKMDLELDLSCVETVYCGAAILQKEVAEALNKKLGGSIYYRQVYGMTEACGVVAVVPTKDSPYGGEKVPQGSIGIPVAGCELKICSLDDKKTLGPNTKGEICIRGPLLMTRYISPQKPSARDIDEDGWFHTGDIGYVDENGYLFMVERISELIKYKTHHVSSAELDDVLLSHPAIADAGVVGIPNVEAGEVPYAWVVLKPGAALTEGELQRWVAEKVMDPKKLRGGVKFVPAIPKAPTGKILRREIRQSTIDEMNKQQ